MRGSNPFATLIKSSMSFDFTSKYRKCTFGYIGGRLIISDQNIQNVNNTKKTLNGTKQDILRILGNDAFSQATNDMFVLHESNER